MNAQFVNATLADIVAGNYRAAAVFERHGLDFCCRGRMRLEDACHEHGLDYDAITAELDQAAVDPADQAPDSDPVALIDLIVKRHHAYVRDSIPTIQQHLAKVVSKHAANHPELGDIDRKFAGVCDALMLHMVKEERVLFPYITLLARSVAEHAAPPPDMFGTVQNPIRMMEIEHQDAGDELADIRRLTASYQAPQDACSTFRVLYAELEAFERDLHRHVHLENNVLFPRAIELEEQLQRRARIGCETAGRQV